MNKTKKKESDEGWDEEGETELPEVCKLKGGKEFRKR